MKGTLSYLYGDAYFVEKEKEKLLSSWQSKEEREIDCIVLDGEQEGVARLMLECSAFPFVAKYRVVVVRDPLLLQQASKEELQELTALLQDDQAPIRVLLLAKEAPKATLKKCIEEIGEVKLCAMPKGAFFERWVRDCVEALDRQAGDDIVRWLHQHRLTDDGGAIEKALYHGALFLEKDEKLTANILDKVVPITHEESIFHVLDAIVDGRVQKAILGWQDLVQQGEEGYGFMRLLQQHVQRLLIVKYLRDQGLPLSSIEKEVKAHPFVVKKAFNLASRLSEYTLAEAYHVLAEFDLKSKTQAGFALKDEVEDCIFTLAMLFYQRK